MTKRQVDPPCIILRTVCWGGKAYRDIDSKADNNLASEGMRKEPRWQKRDWRLVGQNKTWA